MHRRPVRPSSLLDGAGHQAAEATVGLYLPAEVPSPETPTSAPQSVVNAAGRARTFIDGRRQVLCQQHYMVGLHEAETAFVWTTWHWLSDTRRSSAIDAQLDRAIDELSRRKTCAVLLSDVVSPVPLSRGVFDFVRRLCNYVEWKQRRTAVRQLPGLLRNRLDARTHRSISGSTATT